MKLETVGKVVVSGGGDRILVGVLMGLLDRVSPLRCYEYIRDDLELLHWLKDEDLAKYNRRARKAHIDLSKICDVGKDRIMTALEKFHPELWKVIHGTPGGTEWFDRQIVLMREKLRKLSPG